MTKYSTKVLLSLLLFAGYVHADKNEDLYSLAEAIYFESRSEPLACQIVMAQVTLNRVRQERFPNTVREVIHQKKRSHSGRLVCQYSYACDGKSDVMTNLKAQLKSFQVASMVLYGGIPDLSEGADHYYAHNIVRPSWNKGMYDVFTCDGHTFGKLDW